MLQKLEDMNLMKIINHQQRNKMVKYIVIFASLFFFIAIRFLFLDEKDCIDLYFFLPPIFYGFVLLYVSLLGQKAQLPQQLMLYEEITERIQNQRILTTN